MNHLRHECMDLTWNKMKLHEDWRWLTYLDDKDGEKKDGEDDGGALRRLGSLGGVWESFRA